GDRPEPVETGRLQDLDREEAGQQTTLHVGHARPEGTVALDPEGTFGDGPRVEHRVGVADHQDPGATAPLEPPDQEVAEPLLVALGFVPHPPDGPPTALEPRLAQVGALVHALVRERATGDVHHLAERLDEVAVALLGELSEFADVGHRAEYRFEPAGTLGGASSIRGWLDAAT